MINMRIDGVDALRQKFRQAPPVIVNVSRGQVTSTVKRIAARARDLAPYRTGKLKQSIAWEVEKGGLRGGVGVVGGNPALVYWRFVEFGTRHSFAQPFFRPAAAMEQQPFVHDMGSVLRHALEGL